MEYQANNDPLIKARSSMPKPVVKIAEKLLQQGKTCEETAKVVSVRKQTIVNLRKEMEGEGKLELGSWKKEVAGLLGDFVQRGAVRLAENVDNIPIGQLPMAIAIAIDKVRDLADAPTVRVEARLRISQDELNRAFSGGELPIEISEVKKEEKELDQTEIQGTTDADENPKE